MKKKMIFHQHALRIAWDTSVEQFRENLPWAMIALAIVAGTCIAVFIFISIGECCCRSKEDRRRRRNARRSPGWGQSLGRIVFLMFAVVIAAGGFWIAATTFGVSFWNIIFSYGIVTLFIGQVFGVSLQNLGAYIQIIFTAKVVNDMYVKFLRTPMEGRVTNMNISWFELERKTPDGKIVYFYVPTREFVASPFLYIEDAVQPALTRMKIT